MIGICRGDIDYIIDESLKWHISSYNSKATTVPNEWKDSVNRWLLKMGYRFELRKFTYKSIVSRGGDLRISALWANVGVAPIYINYPIVIRIRNDSQSYTLISKEDITKWMPDMDILMEEKFVISEEFEQGIYTIAIGIETGIKEVGNIELAIDGEQNGYYLMGNIVIE